MRKFVPIGVIVASLIAACGGSSAAAAPSGPVAPQLQAPQFVMVFEVKMPDGRIVPCVYAAAGYQDGGVSCDFNPH